MSPPLLEIEGLTKHFPVTTAVFPRKRVALVKAVDGIDFAVDAGKTLGIIGESGCGKTTTSKLILLQESPTAGAIRFDGQDITELGGAELMRYRREVQVVFQDPYSSLSPRMRVSEIIAEPLQIHTDLNRQQQQERVGEVLDLVGLRPEVASCSRTNSPAASASASRSPGRWSPTRASLCSTSRYRRSTCRSAPRS
jgi:ABC-type glutathione transport system ATPase component